MTPITPVIVLTFALQSIIPVGYPLTLTPQAAQVSPSTLPAVPPKYIGTSGGISAKMIGGPAKSFGGNSASDLRSLAFRKSRPHLQYTQVAVSNYSYDGNGNLTSDGVNAYAYDVENRMTSTPNASYAYDGLGKRISKTVSGTTTYFVYDGDRIAEERNSGGALIASYIYGDGIDEVLTMNRNNTAYYYFTDGLGSVTDITNANGEVVENYSYDPYGQPNQTSSIGNPFMFTGRQYDDESGLYYYRARMYSPSLGRFLQRDPIGYYDSMNLYSYTKNNPINYTDPDGRNILYIVSVGVVVIVVAGTTALVTYLINRGNEISGLYETQRRMSNAKSLEEFTNEYSNFCDIRSERVTSPEVQVGIPLIGVANDYGQGPIDAIPAITGEISGAITEKFKK